jgi:hypothetical protein
VNFAVDLGYLCPARDQLQRSADAAAIAAAWELIDEEAVYGDDNSGTMAVNIRNQTWDNMRDGTGTDEWKWDPETKTARPGCDRILEVNLYPRGTGSPGNRGTVDIGSSNNSTCDISCQIVEGISPQDMEHHNHRLEFDENGRRTYARFDRLAHVARR